MSNPFVYFRSNFFGLLSLVIICLSSAPKNLDAAHIVGGDVTYTCLLVDSLNQQTTFQIFYTIYRDSGGGGALLDQMPFFGIYRQNANGSWTVLDGVTGVQSAPLQNQADVAIEDNPCVETPSDVGVEKGDYTFEITLDWSDFNYMVAYQRCCRNNTIGNIVNPGDAGAAYTIEIYPEAQRACNNSPVFKNFPPIFICNGIFLEFDHGATDAEGDEIRYSFCSPQTAGGTAGSGAGNGGQPTDCDGVRPAPGDCPPPYDVVNFLGGFSESAPLAGDPTVSINSLTGVISGIPTINGQFVVGVCATEFRDGQVIGIIRRDFQFNVVPCTKLVDASVASDATETLQNGDQNYFVNGCGVTTLNLKNTSTIEQYITSYHWQFEIDGVLQESFERDANITFPGVGEYVGFLVLNEETPQCADTALITVNLFPAITADFEFDYDTCIAGPVNFFDQSITGGLRVEEWLWDFDDGSQDLKQNPFHQFSEPGTKTIELIATDNNECMDTITKEIDWFPAPPILIVEPNNFVGCVPGEIFFNNLSSPIDSTYDITWDFGDGTTDTVVSPSHVFEDPGVYSITLDVTSPIGCQKDITFPNWIRIEEAPIADFTFSPNELTNFNSTVQFTDLSTNARAYQWDFDGIGTTLEQNPVFTFPDTGMYEVKLTVIHESGCPDTITKVIDVTPKITFFLPNAFTPNNDGKNDLFLGKGFFNGMREFRLTVWNRWGEMVFESNDPDVGWNGSKNNNGSLAPQGVYVYVMKVVGPRGEIREANGNVTLIR